MTAVWHRGAMARCGRWLPGLLVVALLALAGCGSASSADRAGSATADLPSGTGRTADLDFTGTTLAGDTFDGAELAGQPVVLWWWAPWCPTCIAQSTNLSALADRHQGDVSVVGVGGLDAGPDIARVAESIPHVTHLVDPDGAVWRHFGVQEQSAYTVISANGEILSEGYLDDDQLNELVDQLVG